MPPSLWPRVVAAPDKFRGTATASDVAAAIVHSADAAGWECVSRALADGGEGTLEVLACLGGAWRQTVVTGPLGDPVDARWLFVGTTAYIEMAQASGLIVVGGAEHNDALAASTFGTGELIASAIGQGARRVVVTLGGSATTDGGFGALRALEPLPRLRGIELIVACDVETVFVDAAADFGPQKGATTAQVSLLRRRLERLADIYATEHQVDVRDVPGSGAAGGLAGGLLVVGARLNSGFDLVADAVGLDEALDGARLVVTGEGFLDAESFHGKVVGGVCARAASAGVPVLIVCGDFGDFGSLPTGVTVVSMTQRFGRERSWGDPTGAIAEIVAETLNQQNSS